MEQPLQQHAVIQIEILHKAAGEMKTVLITYVIARTMCFVTSAQTSNARTVKLMGSAIPGNVETPYLLTMEGMTECASALQATSELLQATSILAAKLVMAVVVTALSRIQLVADTQTVAVDLHRISTPQFREKRLSTVLLPAQPALQELRQTAQTQLQVQLLGLSLN
jgi:hypothetical protein